MKYQLSLSLLFDPILRAPILAAMLMGLATSLVGVASFLKKQTLIGETLSHASYPGIVIAISILCTFQDTPSEREFIAAFFFGSLCTGLLGIATLNFLEKKIQLHSDAALCFILSSFFGVGLTVASVLQSANPIYAAQVQSLLYGQPATMTDIHIWIYLTLAMSIIGFLSAFYKEIQMSCFDPIYAKLQPLRTKWIQQAIDIITVVTVIISIRCVGVILVSAMLIAPAVTARQFTFKLPSLFAIAGFVGMLSGFLGNVTSFIFSHGKDVKQIESLPIGPLIALSCFLCATISLFISPHSGIFAKKWRAIKFNIVRLEENTLKVMWRIHPTESIRVKKIYEHIALPNWIIFCCIVWMIQKKLIITENYTSFSLSESGCKKAKRIVRLHRLWELYLVTILKMPSERVHRSANEIEHIITPEIESELDALLKNPTKDPHNQIIPPA